MQDTGEKLFWESCPVRMEEKESHGGHGGFLRFSGHPLITVSKSIYAKRTDKVTSSTGIPKIPPCPP
jgi:hypothetical protein